jgi:hypothetical protein
MKLPDSVRVGPFDILLGELDEKTAKKIYGLFSEESQMILLRPKFASGTQCAETLIHELLHAIWNVQNIGGANEERVVTKMSLGLAQVMRDNKELIRSILKALK